MRIPVNRHRIWQLFADAAFVAAAWWLAYQLRFDHGVPRFYQTLFERTILIVLGIKLVVFVLFGFYNRWWRYVSTKDMWAAARGVTVACLIADVTVYFASPVHDLRLPRSVVAEPLVIEAPGILPELPHVNMGIVARDDLDTALLAPLIARIGNIFSMRARGAS